MLTRFIDPVKALEKNLIIMNELEKFVDEFVDTNVSDTHSITNPSLDITSGPASLRGSTHDQTIGQESSVSNGGAESVRTSFKNVLQSALLSKRISSIASLRGESIEKSPEQEIKEELRQDLDKVFKKNKSVFNLARNPSIQQFQRQKSLEKLSRQSTNLTTVKYEDISKIQIDDKQPMKLYKKFNVYKISPTLQQVYDDLKMAQPIKKQLTLRQSYSHANLNRHKSKEPKDLLILPPGVPIDVENAPNFYLKFANLVIDQEQRKLVSEYRKMTGEYERKAGLADPNGQALDI